MLAQNFKTAKELHLTEPQLDALIKTLALLEQGKLIHVQPSGHVGDRTRKFTGHFNMDLWRNTLECGTVACIGGTAELIGGVRFGDTPASVGLTELFYPRTWDYRNITPAQAAQALRGFLTTGDAKWDDVDGLSSYTG